MIRLLVVGLAVLALGCAGSTRSTMSMAECIAAAEATHEAVTFECQRAGSPEGVEDCQFNAASGLRFTRLACSLRGEPVEAG